MWKHPINISTPSEHQKTSTSKTTQWMPKVKTRANQRTDPEYPTSSESNRSMPEDAVKFACIDTKEMA